MTTLTLRFDTEGASRPPDGPAAGGPAGGGAALRPVRPLDPAWAELAGLAGLVGFGGDPEALARSFPAAAALLGARRVAALGATTFLVGMVCPGLHSIFDGLSLGLVEDDRADGLRFAVTAADARFSRVAMRVSGSGIDGTIEAFRRTPPAPQASLAAIRTRVAAGEFAGAHALVIGGSRGLGEVTSRILAAGGAEITLTFAAGRAEAEAIAAEINEGGGRARAVPYDARQPAGPQLAGLAAAPPTHLYYFATPPIFQRAGKGFDAPRFAAFNAVYVAGFADALEACQELGGLAGAFYPSSVAVQDLPPDMTEYAMSKAAGEAFCQAASRADLRLHLVVERLPRIRTDQTASLVQVPAGDPADVMLPIVRNVQADAPARHATAGAARRF